MRTSPATSRTIQIVLGLIWLFDGLLQLQKFMFTSAFATTVIAPAGIGQPVFVAIPVAWAVHIILRAPATWNLLFAAMQLLIGIGFLFKKTVRPAIILSVVWGLSVWFFGEGLGGLATGTSSLITGAPGAALLYVVLGLAVWPSHKKPESPAAWLTIAWAAVWLGGAVLTLLPAQRSAVATTNLIMGQAMSAPTNLMNFDTHVNNGILAAGGWSIILFCLVQAGVGIGIFFQKIRPWAVWVGIVLAVAFWAVGQSFGMLFSGSATDPNTGPLIVLLGLALLVLFAEKTSAKSET